MTTTPGSGQARFPGFDVLGQQATWDDVTKGTVLARLSVPGDLRFFTAEQEPTAQRPGGLVCWARTTSPVSPCWR